MGGVPWGREDGVQPLISSSLPPLLQTSFYGRFRHFLDIIDPRTLFVTEVSHGCHPRWRPLGLYTL